MNLMLFAGFLYKKLRAADPKIREQVSSFLGSIQKGGAIPLGIRKDERGEEAYWWLVYDASRHPSTNALSCYLKERTPTNMKMVILSL